MRELGDWEPDWSWSPAPIEEPVTEPAPPATHEIPSLEKHRFSIAKDEGVVGSLGTIQLRDGDTLPDVARHFGLGYEEIVAANIDLDPWVPGANSSVLIPLQFVLPQAPRRGIVINLAALRLFYFPAKDNGAQVVTYAVGIGREGKSTPRGNMWIARKMKNPTWYPTKNILEDHLRRGNPLPAAVPPGPDNPLGQYAMYLSRPMYLMHGTNKPYSVGLRASNGCIRLYPENADLLYKVVALKEAVHIVNQPFLVGRRGGVLYLQAYLSHEELNENGLKKTLRADLKKWEREQNQPLDWDKIERIVEEGRGIPLPISKGTPSADAMLLQAQPIVRPTKWFGQPESPPEAADGWHVSAADTASEISARRIAAVLNHQGPPIPARAVLNGERYQVIAGPFADAKAAKAVVKRLKADLELEGRIIAPKSELATTSPAEPAAPKPAVPDANPSQPTAADATIPEGIKPESAPSAVSGSGADGPESTLSTDVPPEAAPHESINSNAASPEWRMPEMGSPRSPGPNPLEFPPKWRFPTRSRSQPSRPDKRDRPQVD